MYDPRKEYVGIALENGGTLLAVLKEFDTEYLFVEECVNQDDLRSGQKGQGCLFDDSGVLRVGQTLVDVMESKGETDEIPLNDVKGIFDLGLSLSSPILTKFHDTFVYRPNPATRPATR